jgi:hypothetical protein
MEIFTPEFREELMDNLETITIGLKSDLPINKVKELNDKINLALQKERDIANPKKKKNKKFKKGDVVYWGEREGIVANQFNDNTEQCIYVSFKENGEFKSWDVSFTKDGRYINGTPIVLSHFPYKLKMKKIK